MLGIWRRERGLDAAGGGLSDRKFALLMSAQHNSSGCVVLRVLLVDWEAHKTHKPNGCIPHNVDTGRLVSRSTVLEINATTSHAFASHVSF